MSYLRKMSMLRRGVFESLGSSILWFLVLVPVLGVSSSAAADSVSSSVCGLHPGQIHTEEILLDADRIVRLRVSQRGAEVRVNFKSPAGEVLMTSDLMEDVGEERLLWVTSTPGHYLLEVIVEAPRGAGKLSKLTESRCFTVAQEEPIAASEKDRERVSALELLLQGKAEKSEEKLEESLGLWKSLEEIWWQAQTLITMAELFEKKAPSRVREFYERSLKIAEDPVQAAMAHYGLSFTLSDDRKWQPALDELTLALDLWQSIHGAEHQIARTSTQAGLMNVRLGNYSGAMHLYDRAIELCERGAFFKTKATALNNRARIDVFMRRWDRAAEALEESITIRRAHGYGLGIPAIWRSYVNVQRGEVDIAQRTLRDVLDLEIDDLTRADAWLALGHAQGEAGDVKQASKSFQHAATFYEALGMKREQAVTEYRQGRMHMTDEQPGRALVAYQEALEKFVQVGDLNGRAEAFYGIAGAQFRLGHLKDALQAIDEALDLIEELRADSDAHDFQTQFFASRQHFYELQIELLMEMHRREPGGGYQEAAWVVSERARARALLETVKGSGGRIYSDRYINLIRREENLLEEIRENVRKSSRRNREEIRQGRLRNLKDQLRKIRAEIRRHEPVYASVMNLAIPSVEKVRKEVLDENTALLGFYLGEQKSYLWYVTKKKFLTFQLPAASVFDAKIKDFHDLVDYPHQDQLELLLGSLGTMIFSGLQIDAEIDRLLVVGDGALQKFPFSLLPLPGGAREGSFPQRFVHRYEIIQPPSVSVLSALRERREKQTPSESILIVSPTTGGEPSPPSVSKEEMKRRADFESRHPKLIHAGDEIRAIQENYEKSDLVEGSSTEKRRFLGSDFESYRMIHIITHGVFDRSSGDPYLVLSPFHDDGSLVKDWQLRLPEVYELNLAAELVVLSACETALGEVIRGEGLLGMSYGFLYAGASTVAASLWSVPDPSTAALMEIFYERLRQGDTPAAALRSAQLEFLAKFPGSRAPYKWAGFVIQGAS